MLHNLSIGELGRALRAGKTSSVEITRHFLSRIERLNPALNALITVTAEQALAAAAAADGRRAAGEQGPLLGIPLIHKDIFCTDGVRTSCGSRMLDNFIAPYDATVVTRLKEAGTVMLAKANMDEFAMGSSNETSFYGPVKNPWDTRKVPGGSHRCDGRQTDIRTRVALRHDRLRVQPRPGRCPRPLRRGCGHRPCRHGRVRSEGVDQP